MLRSLFRSLAMVRKHLWKNDANLPVYHPWAASGSFKGKNLPLTGRETQKQPCPPFDEEPVGRSVVRYRNMLRIAAGTGDLSPKLSVRADGVGKPGRAIHLLPREFKA